MSKQGNLPWVVGGLAAILIGLYQLRQPVPEPPAEPTPAPRVARLATEPQDAGSGADAGDAHADPQADRGEAHADPAADEEPTGNPFAVFLEPPDLLTAGQENHPAMESLDATDARYSATIEARQLFAPFEQALVAEEPLNPGIYKALLTEYKDQNTKVIKRADWLRKSGQPDAATDLMAEWGRLFDHYKAQAYGRGQVPVPEEQ